MRHRPTTQSILAIVDILKWIEQHHAAGPWDEYDGELIQELRAVTKRHLGAALEAATPTRSGPDQPCPACGAVASSFAPLQLATLSEAYK